MCNEEASYNVNEEKQLVCQQNSTSDLEDDTPPLRMEVWFNKTTYDRLYRCDYLNESRWRDYAVPHPISGYISIVLGVIYFVSATP
uniref:Neur_chan_LBD domain-containing protein n=1 Tax=Steinernema glaseri TaxID=37863 RepID=A0A1I8AT51_9BILA